MSLLRMKAVGSLFLAALLSTAAWAVTPVSPGTRNNVMPPPGTLNYVEGNASLGNETLTNKSVGEVTLAPGQTLNTGNGKAEVLLTPGVFLRLGENSSAKMISPDLTNTAVELDRGRAMVEVDDIHKENNLRITEDGVQTQLLKKGLYDFDADDGQIRVDKGKAEVLYGDHKDKLESHQMADLRRSNDGKLKRENFDPKKYQGDLYAFSSLRSQYLAQASDEGSRIYVGTGYGWGPGWWWDPWFGGYTYFPAAGFLNSPFGWGFYSPVVWYGGGGRWFGPRYNGHLYGHWRGPMVVGGPAVAGGRPIAAVHPTPIGGFHAGNIGFAHAGGFGAFHGGVH